MKLITSLILMLCFFQCNAYATEVPKRVALLIGNWDYNLNKQFDSNQSFDYINDLKTPCADINLVKTELKKHGFDIYDYCNTEKDKFDRSIADFSEATKNLPEKSIIFVYYAGHGMQYRGRVFTLPVLFKLDQDKLNRESDAAQLKYFQKNANEISRMLAKLNDNNKIGVIVALDNCRDGVVNSQSVYNEAVSIRIAPNTLIQYATTAGDTTPDADGKYEKNSAYANILASEISRGGDVGDVMGRVGSKIWEQYAQNKRETYAETDVGPAFSALKYLPLKNGATEPLTVSSNISRKKIMIRNVYDGVTLDILWCEGDGEKARYDFAQKLAQDLKDKASYFGVGRIMIKPLSENDNANNGYNVYRNIMRYDPAFTKEKELLEKIARAYPQGAFLPRRGVGVNGKPTENYISAFVCGRIQE